METMVVASDRWTRDTMVTAVDRTIAGRPVTKVTKPDFRGYKRPLEGYRGCVVVILECRTLREQRIRAIRLQQNALPRPGRRQQRSSLASHPGGPPGR